MNGEYYYFYSARQKETGEIAVGEFPADSFTTALTRAMNLAHLHFRGGPFRITNLTERPRLEETGPLAIALRQIGVAA